MLSNHHDDDGIILQMLVLATVFPVGVTEDDKKFVLMVNIKIHLLVKK